jgi:hypothetical protein
LQQSHEDTSRKENDLNSLRSLSPTFRKNSHSSLQPVKLSDMVVGTLTKGTTLARWSSGGQNDTHKIGRVFGF